METLCEDGTVQLPNRQKAIQEISSAESDDSSCQHSAPYNDQMKIWQQRCILLPRVAASYVIRKRDRVQPSLDGIMQHVNELWY
jgi:hypothetical protein